MQRLFKLEDGFAVPELNSEAAWVFSEPAIVQEYYDGSVFVMKKSWLGGYKWYLDSPTGLIRTDIEKGPLSSAISRGPFNTIAKKFYPGEYVLVNLKVAPRLIPLDNCRQMGDVQALELDLAETVQQGYDDLRKVLEYLPVKGLVFKTKGRRPVVVWKDEFDYSKDVQEPERGERKTLSPLPDGQDNDGPPKRL